MRMMLYAGENDVLMKRLKQGYIVMATICVCLVVVHFIKESYWKGIACASIVSILWFFYLFDYVAKMVDDEFASWYISTLLDKLEKEITKEEIYDILRYTHKFPGVFLSIDYFLERLVVYLEEEVPDEKLEYVVNAVLAAQASIDYNMFTSLPLGFLARKSVYRARDALAMRFGSIVKHLYDVEETQLVKRLLLPYLPYALPGIYYIISLTSIVNENLACFVDYSYLFIILTYTITLDYFLRKKDRTTEYTFCVWCLHWVITGVYPALLPVWVFEKNSTFLFFHLNYLILSITGIRLINRMWHKTTLENNLGVYIGKNDWIKVFAVKIINVIRVPALWIAFFLAITETILMYTFVYSECLVLGEPLECLFLSISTYFCGPVSINNSLSGVYFLSETVIAFFLNTLYLANIVQLILEPKLRND